MQVEQGLREMEHSPPGAGRLIGGLRQWWRSIRGLDADPFAAVEGVEGRLWLLSLLIICLLAVAIYLLNAAAPVQEAPRAKPVVAFLANDITALILLVTVLLIC